MTILAVIFLAFLKTTAKKLGNNTLLVPNEVGGLVCHARTLPTVVAPMLKITLKWHILVHFYAKCVYQQDSKTRKMSEFICYSGPGGAGRV